ncbi:MAG: hypothetical protein ACXIUQ_06070 [Cecembia sp.]
MKLFKYKIAGVALLTLLIGVGATINRDNGNDFLVKEAGIVLSPLHDSYFDSDGFSSISPWVFPPHTLDIVDSYIPFIFRTKRSSHIEQLKVIISIDNRGNIIKYQVLNPEADKGLKERVGHVVRNLPNAVPVPGFDRYDAMDFELIIRK